MQEFDELDEQLSVYEERLKQMQKNQQILESQHYNLCEQRDVLTELSEYLEGVQFQSLHAH